MWKQPKWPMAEGINNKWQIHTMEYTFNHKEEENSDTHYSMDEPWRHSHAKWKKLVTKDKYQDSTHMRYLKWSNAQRQKMEWCLLGRWKVETGNGCFMSRVSVGGDEKVQETVSDDGCTIMWMYLMPKTVHLKIFKMATLMLRIFNYNFKKRGRREESG